MTARILNVSAAEYHADPLPTPSLSSSIAHTLISESPKHAWLAHPKLGGRAAKNSKTFDSGKLIHELLLGKGGGFVEVEADDFKTKVAREARDAAYAAGLVPVLTDDFLAAQRVAEELAGQLDEIGVRFTGESEVAIAWDERTLHGSEVICRCMMDHLIVSAGTIYDVKTIRSAHPDTCRKHMVEYGYDIQWAAYTSALSKLHPELAGRTDFVFLFCETTPPYCITPVRPSGTMRQLGTSKWDRAVESWAFCLASGKWRGYADSIIEVDAPPWALAKELGEEAA